MAELVRQLIIRHIEGMEQVLFLTAHITRQAQSENIRELEKSILNRQRLINQIIELQKKIEETNPTDINMIQAWHKDSSTWLNKIQEGHQSLINILEHQKNKISKEMASLFKSKSKLKGYNLSNVNR